MKNTTLEIRPTVEKDIYELAEKMSKECVLECECVGYTPLEALKIGFKNAEKIYTGLSDGRVGAIFGVTRKAMLGRRGTIWMLSADLAKKEWFYTAIKSRDFIKSLSSEYTVLDNWVDFRYKRAIKWLRWLGFKIHKPVPNGKNGELMCYFKKEVSNV